MRFLIIDDDADYRQLLRYHLEVEWPEAVIDERLRNRNLREQTLTGLHSLFQICNQARYAPVRSKHELDSVVGRVEAMLTDLQKIEA